MQNNVNDQIKETSLIKNVLQKRFIKNGHLMFRLPVRFVYTHHHLWGKLLYTKVSKVPTTL